MLRSLLPMESISIWHLHAHKSLSLHVVSSGMECKGNIGFANSTSVGSRHGSLIYPRHILEIFLTANSWPNEKIMMSLPIHFSNYIIFKYLLIEKYITMTLLLSFNFSMMSANEWWKSHATQIEKFHYCSHHKRVFHRGFIFIPAFL